jgi:hypothetical protein
MLDRQTDCTVYLIRHGGADARGFRTTDLGRRGFEEHLDIPCCGVRRRVGGRSRRGQLAGQARDIHLHRLKFRDGLAERDALTAYATVRPSKR